MLWLFVVEWVSVGRFVVVVLLYFDDFCYGVLLFVLL